MLIFDYDAYLQELVAVFGPGIEQKAWSYPPHFLLFLLPLQETDLVWSAIAYQIIGLVFFGVAVWLFLANTKFGETNGNARLLFLALAPFCWLQLIYMHNGYWVAGFMLLGFCYAGSRPVFAGLCFAVLTIKPQLGILIPVYLIFCGYWKTIASTIIWTAAILCMTGMIFGFEIFPLFFSQTMPNQTEVLLSWDGFVGMMPGIIGALRVYKAPSDMIAIMYFAWVSLLIVPIILLIWKCQDPLHRIYVTICGTFVISPYSVSYDMGALSAVAALILIREDFKDDEAGKSLFLALMTVLPVLVFPLSLSYLTVVPFILVGSLVWIWWQSRGKPTAEPTITSPTVS
ncbi:MAG: glycosyltransferase family 87 protein [Pseudomonadota bacterium]